jgi:pimeloyl-ACP methyl ester carboxylesterase
MTTEATADTSKEPASGYAPVNGLSMYYEIHGTGRPLVLLHGGLGTVDMLFAPLLPALAASRQVIGVELQAHGHTADIDRPLSYEQMADDVAALIAYLGLGPTDLCGFSLGGGVALQTAIRHPAAVRKLSLISTVYRRDGWYPETLAGMAMMNAEVAMTWVGSPMHKFYADVAPRPEDWPALVVKTEQLLRQDYDWTEGVRALQAPAQIVLGDADGVRPAHALEMFALLGGGLADAGYAGLPNAQLAIVPGATHLDILTRTDLLPAIILPFLDAPMPIPR